MHRVLEPEVMDSPQEAQDYDSMDHAEVNARFVSDLLAAGPVAGLVLDLGTGTAQIPIELCRRTADCRILAGDAAVAMLDLAVYNVEVAGFRTRIQLAQLDAKRLPQPDGTFQVVMSNSIVHHIPQPAAVLAEAVRVTAPGGRLFFRDLLRPADDAEAARLVELYAAGASERQRALFEASLRAALALDEVRALTGALGFGPETVAQTSDRHWTWAAVK